MKFKEDMYVVFDRIDEHGRAFVVFQDGRHVSVQGFANLVADDRHAVFGTENEVDIYLGE